LSGTQLDASASVPGSFVYTPASGVVLNAGTHTLQVTFTPTDTTNYTTASSSVSLTVNKATPLITWNKPADITYGTVLSGTQLDASASLPESFVYTPASENVLSAGTHTLHVDFTPTDAANYNNEINAAVSVPGSFVYTPASGVVLNAGNHTLQVTFTPTDTTNYATTSRSVSLTVNKATPLITWSNPADITYGTVLSETQLDASASLPGSFVYTPASGNILSAGTHTLHVDFTPTDAANYNNAITDVTINVSEATREIPIITWSNPDAIGYGTALSETQLNASASLPGSFVYTPASGVVLNAGTHTLQVTFTPTDTTNYTTTSSSVSLTVNKATPLITWSNPVDITYGTVLSETQLNASASLPGSFVYNPVSGTILSVGTHTLQTTFTPTDSTNYTTASSSVSLTVNKAHSNSGSNNGPTKQKILEPNNTQALNSSENIGTEIESESENKTINKDTGTEIESESENKTNTEPQTEPKKSQNIPGFEICCGVACLLGAFLYKRK
jgi:2-keto-3-deoxy-6-phosphogluconate aldolase